MNNNNFSSIESVLDSIDETICNNRVVTETMTTVFDEIEHLRELAITLIDNKILSGRVQNEELAIELKDDMKKFNEISIKTLKGLDEMENILMDVVKKVKDTTSKKNQKIINDIINKMNNQTFQNWINYLEENRHYFFDNYTIEIQKKIMNEFLQG